MPRFKYSAKAADGGSAAGTLDAQDAGDALGQLRRQGLIPLAVEEEGKARSRPGGKSRRDPRPRVSSDDLVVFTRQLSTMISAGVPIMESLAILADQVEDKGFRAALNRVVESIRGGTDLSEALSLYPKIFPAIYVNMVKAGEASGKLDEILVRLAEYQEAAAHLKREVKSAMAYPAISLFLILGITVFLMLYVVPIFQKLFMSLHATLPAPTVLVLGVSDFLVKNWMWLLGGLVLLVVGFILYRRTPKGRYNVDAALLRMPVFGPLTRKIALSRFSRTFATLLQSGVPMLGALEIVASTSGNQVLEKAILAAREGVRQGDPLAAHLGRSPVFPPMVVKMIAIGEKTGALETLLSKISEFYDQQVSAMVKGLTALIEPILISVMGVIVGCVVSAIFLPIFTLPAQIGRKGK